MVIFNRFKVNYSFFLLTIIMWIFVFMTGCSTPPWNEDEIARVSEVGENKTVPLVLIEMD